MPNPSRIQSWRHTISSIVECRLHGMSTVMCSFLLPVIGCETLDQGRLTEKPDLMNLMWEVCEMYLYLKCSNLLSGLALAPTFSRRVLDFAASHCTLLYIGAWTSDLEPELQTLHWFLIHSTIFSVSFFLRVFNQIVPITKRRLTHGFVRKWWDPDKNGWLMVDQCWSSCFNTPFTIVTVVFPWKMPYYCGFPIVTVVFPWHEHPGCFSSVSEPWAPRTCPAMPAAKSAVVPSSRFRGLSWRWLGSPDADGDTVIRNGNHGKETYT